MTKKEKTFAIQIGDEVRQLTLTKAFALAESICASAYAAQGGPTADYRERLVQQDAREHRKASAFELLYCQLRDIANDWHREALRRRDGQEKGAFDEDYCHEAEAIESTIRVAYVRIRGWDY